MPETSLQETWSVRPPWPDELPRLVASFQLGALRPHTRRTWLWVLAIGELERLAGFLALSEEVLPTLPPVTPPIAWIDYTLRDRWAGSDAAHTLLRAALEQGRALGLRHCTCQVDPGSAFLDVLRENGFAAERIQETWRCPLDAPVQEYEPRVDRMLRRFPIRVTPLEESHLEVVRAICRHYHLLSPERVFLHSPGAEAAAGFDARYSFLAGDPAQPAALLLSRVSNHTLYIEVLARNPASPASPVAIAALLKAVMPRARDAGLTELQCVVQSADTSSVRALLERGGGHCERRHGVFTRTLAEINP